MTNNTENITLLDLLTEFQTSFKLEVEDTSLNPYVEKYTALLRWYPNLNDYEIAEMGFTDGKGETVIHVETEDVDYRVAVYNQNGTLIKLEDPTRFVCLVNPCTYTLKIDPSSRDYTSFFDVYYYFAPYNQSNGMWYFEYSDSSQKTQDMNLTVYKVTGTSVYPICSDDSTGFTGVLTCNTSAYSGNFLGEVRRTASPQTPIAQQAASSSGSAMVSSFGLIISLLIAIPIIFIFALYSPVGALIGGIVSLIPSLYFGSIGVTIIGGFAILAGIVAHFLKRIG